MEHDTTSAPTAGRGRVLAFRIVAGIFGALLILLNASFGLSPLFNEADKVHSFHQIGPLFFYTLLIGLPLIMLAIHPADVTALRVAWAAVLGPVIASFMGQDFLSGTYYLAPIGEVVRMALPPGERKPGEERDGENQQGDRHVVRVVAGFQLVEEPQPFLNERD